MKKLYPNINTLTACLIFGLSIINSQAQNCRVGSDYSFFFYGNTIDTSEMNKYFYNSDSLPYYSENFIRFPNEDTLRKYTNKLTVYNNDKQKLRDSVSNWNSSKNTWDKNYVYVYTYNSNKTLDSLTLSVYDSTNSIWNNSQNTKYQYTSQKEIKEKTVKYWSNSAWVNATKEIYDQDSLSLNYSYDLQNWDANSSQWKNFKRYIYIYNSDSSIASETKLKWVVNAWVNESRIQYIYKINKRDSLINSNLWDLTNQVWKNASQIRVSYDNNSNIDSINNYLYFNNQYHPNYIQVYTYYQNGCMHTYDFFTNYNFDSSKFLNHKQIEYIKFSNSVGIAKIDKNSKITVYPNPANEVLIVKSDVLKKGELYIYNAMGQSMQVSTSEVSDEEKRLDISSLASGFYILKIGEFTVRFMKE